MSDGIDWFDPADAVDQNRLVFDMEIHQVDGCAVGHGAVSYATRCGCLFSYPLLGPEVMEARIELPPVNCPGCLK